MVKGSPFKMIGGFSISAGARNLHISLPMRALGPGPSIVIFQDQSFQSSTCTLLDAQQTIAFIDLQLVKRPSFENGKNVREYRLGTYDIDWVSPKREMLPL